MIIAHSRIQRLAVVLAFVITAMTVSRPALAKQPGAGENDPVNSPALVPLDEFSPAFLGVYRKIMEIEGDIIKYSTKYGVDLSLARAVCMYESGGNANLTSGAGLASR